MVRIRNVVYTAVVVFAVITLPLLAFAAPLVSCMSPVDTGTSCETAVSCMGTCLLMTQVNSAFRREPISRSSAFQSYHSSCSSASQQLAHATGIQGMIGLNNRFSGIRRIYPKNVLDHPQRKAVYSIILDKPGIDMVRIGKVLSLNRETLRYHLNQLSSSNKIIAMKDYGIIRYYENHGRYGTVERRVLAYLWNPTAERILSIVQSNPGITQGDIATRLAIASPTVHWYMQRLTNDGIIIALHASRLTRYHLTAEAFQVLTNSAGIRQRMQTEVCTP
ncbi:winged helix-turn-helix transcriptional regulator [Methanolobus chelungpuianus]|uniref:winged helix-turn-helix transcriptional regulator n=1 Tax=Methanolobus chelungpuianus TaxID=502115 RepID=UPI0021155278|nr:winged helix-turn-helix transcriptional regulator [Methanolobus chelungpuianus]